MRNFAVALVIIGLSGTPALTEAQTRVSLHRGTSEYDLSGVDTAPTTAVRAARNLSSLLLIEAGLSWVEFEPQFGSSSTLYMPEAQLQVQLPLGRFGPYVGAGAGMGIDKPEDSSVDSETDVTFVVGGGLRIDLPFHVIVIGDARLRGFGTRFTGSGTEATLGIGFRF